MRKKHSQIRLQDIPAVVELCALRERIMRAARRAPSVNEVCPGVALAVREIKKALQEKGLKL